MSSKFERANLRCLELLKDRITTHIRVEPKPRKRGGHISSAAKCREWGLAGRRASSFTGRGIVKRKGKWSR